MREPLSGMSANGVNIFDCVSPLETLKHRTVAQKYHILMTSVNLPIDTSCGTSAREEGVARKAIRRAPIGNLLPEFWSKPQVNLNATTTLIPTKEILSIRHIYYTVGYTSMFHAMQE